MDNRLNNTKLCTLVAQTPFQLFNAILIAELSLVRCDLWLIDKGLLPYLDNIRNLKFFNEIFYTERNIDNLWSTTVIDRFTRLKKILLSQKKIKYYLKEKNPTIICIFSDNIELTASFSTFGKKYTKAKIVLIEEGTTVYFSPFRVHAPHWKGIVRSLLGIQNPNGYSIGWSTGIDTLLVSYIDKIHPELSQNREVIQWPDGPFPESTFQKFSTLMNMETLPCSADVRLIYIGQPFQESGLLTKEDEERFLEAMNNHYMANKIWIKTHPFDSEDKYNFCKNLKLFNRGLKDTPVEVLFHFLKPEIVISYFSSAGLNYCIREGKPAIFYLPETTAPSFREILKEKFNDISTMYIVDNLEEIPKAIDTLLNKKIGAMNIQQPINQWQKTVNSIL